MICNLKALGLALVAIFAMSAVAVSAASAQTQGHLTSDGPVTLSITEIGAKGSGLNAFTGFGATFECYGSTFSGHKTGSLSELIPSNATEGTGTPNYNQKECRLITGGSEFEMTVETNGCDYVLHLGETTGEKMYSVKSDIVCPVGNKMQLGVWAVGAKHESTNRFCTVEIPAQSGLSGVEIASTASEQPQITGAFIGIKIERHGLCVLDGKGTTSVEGKTHFDLTATGTNKTGNLTGVSVTD
jgi:hypothetical protein